MIHRLQVFIESVKNEKTNFFLSNDSFLKSTFDSLRNLFGKAYTDSVELNQLNERVRLAYNGILNEFKKVNDPAFRTEIKNIKTKTQDLKKKLRDWTSEIHELEELKTRFVHNEESISPQLIIKRYLDSAYKSDKPAEAK